MEGKIKDIYGAKAISGTDSLVKWHNEVIEKSSDELTVADVARCIRQDLFVETAYETLLAYLLNEPYAGDIYPGELMEKAGEVDETVIKKHAATIKTVIDKAKMFADHHEWDDLDERAEYEEYIEKLKDRLGAI